MVFGTRGRAGCECERAGGDQVKRLPRRWSALAVEVALPLAVLAVLVVADVLLPSSSQITGSFSIAAIVAAMRSNAARTAAIALLSTVLAALAGIWDGNAG